jgi:lipoprotein-releasing system permease protein
MLRILSRIVALVATLALVVAAVAVPAQRTLLAVLAAEVGVFGLVAYLFGFDLERTVAIRYLRRNKPSKSVRVALAVCTTVLLIGLAAFLLGHNHGRWIETLGAFALFGSAVALAMTALLAMFSIFTAVSTLGVALGVASLVVVLSVTSGFEREFQQKVLAVNGHLIATGYGKPEMAETDEEAADMTKKLSKLPGLTKIERFSLSSGEVMIGKVGANLKGLDLSHGGNELSKAVEQGRFEDLGRPATCQPKPIIAGEPAGPPEDAGRILLGIELAQKVRAKVGDCVSILVPFPSKNDSTVPSYPFKVVGIFHLGFNEYDSRLAYVNIEDAKRLAGARQSIFGIELRFEDPIKALGLVETAENLLGPAFRVIDWRSLNANLFTALTMQKVVISIVLLIIIVVAAFNILASLFLIVRTKEREIAILGSMGARPRPILGIFLAAGAIVGLAGGGLGLSLGLALCSIVGHYGYGLDPKVYLIERLPVQISPVEVMLVPALALAICLIATLYPAIKASRLRAVDGLRQD